MRIAQLSVVCMMIVITWDAVGRYVFRRPLDGQVEFTERYLLVILVFLALSGTYSRGGHVRIASLQEALRPGPRRICGVAARLIALAAFAIFAIATVPVAVDKFVTLETTFGVVQFPVYLSYVWVPVGVAMICLRLVADLLADDDRAPPAKSG